MTNAYARLHYLNRGPEPDDDVPAAMWRPLFRTVPALERVSPDARPMRDQMAHYARLVERVPASVDESVLIVQAYQLCERTHGYPAIREALPWVMRLLSNAVRVMHMSATDLAGSRGYPNAGAWAGALIEQHAGIAEGARRFPALPNAPRSGSLNIEFEDIVVGVGLARTLGVVTLHDADDADAGPYIALAAAIRQHHDPRLDDALQRCALVAGAAPNAVAAFIEQVTQLSATYAFALPMTWRWFVAEHGRAQARRGRATRRQ